ncbi:GIY-YIG nuclease family protein [Pontibacter beigongshangensis]|uniref:GIY-YIG nuclease family protein n=1 Tax=Pontibacter beigongshangensis TaxID=2574733 RepID=UPI001650653A|nr:GIY-YIG nuclease family protein [Pontibacter beigongshangensis]
MKSHNYFVYIITNPGKTVLYAGMTNDLNVRLEQHKQNRGKRDSFAGRYYCYKLLYYEHYTHTQHAIEREKEIKLMSMKAKLDLIKQENPSLMFLEVRE